MKKWIIGLSLVITLLTALNYFSIKVQIPSMVSTWINESAVCAEFEAVGASLPINFLYGTKYESTVLLASKAGGMAEVTVQITDVSSPLFRILGMNEARVRLKGSEISKILFCEPNPN